MENAQSIVKTLSKEALEVLKAYEGVPYYNNAHKKVRLGLRALVGKGTPEEVSDEALLYSLREKVDLKTLTPELRKKFLIEHNIGIDCSGLAYHVLDAENKARDKGSLAGHLHYPYANSFWKRLGRFTRARYAENAGARTFAHESNSREVALLDALPGDFLVMLESGTNGPSATRVLDKQPNHIILVHQVLSTENVPTEIDYTHSIAWPADGRYNHGVREGKIVIKNINHALLDQTWLEGGKTGPENFTYHKATIAKSLTLRRLNWL